MICMQDRYFIRSKFYQTLAVSEKLSACDLIIVGVRCFSGRDKRCHRELFDFGSLYLGNIVLCSEDLRDIDTVIALELGYAVMILVTAYNAIDIDRFI